MRLNESYISFFEDFAGQTKALVENTLVITPNRRLSRFVLSQWDAWQQSQGEMAWAELSCLPMDTWLRTLWTTLNYLHENDKPKYALSDSQVQALWMDIIEQDKCGFDLVDTDALAKQAIQAKNTLEQWCIDPEAKQFSSDTYTVFRRWLNAYRAICDRNVFIDAEGQRKDICSLITKRSSDLPKKIVFLEFDTLTPWLKQFIRLLEGLGVDVDQKAIAVRNTGDGAVQQIAARTLESELLSAARWAKKSLEKESDLSIGIVVPTLSSDKSRVERLMAEVLDVQYVDLNTSRRPYTFSISAAEPLNTMPLIKAAFDILALNHNTIPVANVERLVSSPFIKGWEQNAHRYLLIRRLIRTRSTCSLRDLNTEIQYERQQKQKHGEALEDSLSEQLKAFIDLTNKHAGKNRTFSEWREVIAQQLAVFGWGLGRELDSIEYQQWMQWHEVLKEFASLDVSSKPLSLTLALRRLTVLAQVSFHPQTADSPIQVLGMLEAAGLKFDRLWVCGMQQSSWPPAPEPNVFLPFDMQRVHSMPRSSAVRELELARRLTEQFARSATEVYFSYHQTEGDMHCEVSELVAHYPRCETAFDQDPLQSRAEGGALYERCNDIQLPPLPVGQRVRGGASVLKHQSDCPFKAAAKHRLFAWGLEEYQTGVTPRLRGELMHLCLELFWQKVQSQKNLLSLTASELKSTISEVIERSWRTLTTSLYMNACYKKLELDRTLSVMMQWMEIEKKRAEFEVLNREHLIDAQVGPLTLSMRVDRIDKVASTQLVVIDYKTGRSKVKDWLSDRPKDPQLPSYALALEEEVDGVAFAELRLGEVQLKGLGTEQIKESGLTHKEKLGEYEQISEDWSLLKTQWREVLTQLAVDFCDGDARVMPNIETGACDYCDLAALCRVAH